MTKMDRKDIHTGAPILLKPLHPTQTFAVSPVTNPDDEVMSYIVMLLVALMRVMQC